MLQSGLSRGFGAAEGVFACGAKFREVKFCSFGAGGLQKREIECFRLINGFKSGDGGSQVCSGFVYVFCGSVRAIDGFCCRFGAFKGAP